MAVKRKTIRKAAKTALAKYQSMRDFAVTAEPSGKTSGAKPSQRLRYVIQKHAATDKSSAGTTNLGALLKAKLDVANTQQ